MKIIYNSVNNLVLNCRKVINYVRVHCADFWSHGCLPDDDLVGWGVASVFLSDCRLKFVLETYSRETHLFTFPPVGTVVTVGKLDRFGVNSALRSFQKRGLDSVQLPDESVWVDRRIRIGFRNECKGFSELWKDFNDVTLVNNSLVQTKGTESFFMSFGTKVLDTCFSTVPIKVF